MIDLHVHSTYSDGTMTPGELVDYALEKGLTAIALTDHDTVFGLAEIDEYAQDKDIEVIPGIEFSTEYEGKDVHIVGLYIEYTQRDFVKYLKNFIDSRTTRNIKMCEKLTEHGCPMTYDDILKAYPGATITRAHYAAFLLEKGFVKSREEAFDRYIGDNAPCFLPREKVTPEQAIELILKAGGIPILAHPTLYHMSDYKLDKLVCELKDAGLMGIEAIYSTYTEGETRQIKALAAKYDLLVSGGSDFHGANKPKIDLGTGKGNLKVPDEVLVEIKKHLPFYVFSDLDGTLFDDTCIASEELKKSLIAMCERGNYFIPTTGRPLMGVINALKENNLIIPGMKIICNNGAMIYDCDTQKPYIEFRLGQETMRTLLSKADEMGLYAHSYNDESIITKAITAETEYYTRRVHMGVMEVPDIADALPDGAYKIMCISLDDKAKLDKFKKWIDEEMGGEVIAIYSNTRYLELLSSHAGKGNGIRTFCNMNKIPIGRTYACGDQENDISMLKAAGCGVAVANAVPEAKAAADIVTKDDATHDALKPLFDSI